MSKTIKARVSHGVIEPLEEINLLEVEVVTITIVKENEEKKFLQKMRSVMN